MTQGIYTITCRGRVYVGSAVSIEKRWKNHLRQLDKGTHSNPKLQRSWIKYGSEAFAFAIVEVVAKAEDLVPREQRWINLLKCTGRRGLNIAPMAGSCLGRRHSPQTRTKISVSNKGRRGTNRGQRWSAEIRAKVSDSLKGHPVSEETRAKLSAAAKADWAKRKQSG